MELSIKNFIITFIVFLLIDSIWLSISGSHWNKMVQYITGQQMNDTSLKKIISFSAGSTAYLFLALGILVLVVSRINPDNAWKDAMFYGSIFGLSVYGVFDLTNMVLFGPKYNIILGIMDIIWGVIVSILTSYVSFKILNSF